MANPFRVHQRLAALVAGVVTLAVCVTAWFWLSASNDGEAKMGNYGPDKQQEWAERLVAGLNTHDAAQVPVLHIHGHLSNDQQGTIEAAMPAPGCRYALLSVQDRGEQGKQQVPGLDAEKSTYRFDMTVEEQCSASYQSRVLGVVAIAEMGYWDPYSFTS
ncbi:MAG: hypothetical protein H6523_12750 [Mycolicibacterium sp.]|nr:hypothetical protein [Mycolicibacterium sp.]